MHGSSQISLETPAEAAKHLCTMRPASCFDGIDIKPPMRYHQRSSVQSPKFAISWSGHSDRASGLGFPHRFPMIGECHYLWFSSSSVFNVCSMYDVPFQCMTLDGAQLDKGVVCKRSGCNCNLTAATPVKIPEIHAMNQLSYWQLAETSQSSADFLPPLTPFIYELPVVAPIHILIPG